MKRFVLLTLVPACTAGGLAPDPGAGGDDVMVADPDAGVPEPDGGPPACALPGFTGGVSTLGGCGVSGSADGPRGTAQFANPVNVAAAPNGDVFVADFDNDRVRVISPAGEVRTIVAQPRFQKPFGLAVTADGELYVQTDDDDTGAHSIETGTIWRVERDDGGATVVARDLGRPRGLAALPDGRLVLSDYMHHTVRLLDPDDGVVTPLAAGFDMPMGAAVLPDGRIAIADFGNGAIKAIALDGTVETLATGLGHPQGVTVDAAGTIYVTDTDGHVVKRLDDAGVTTVVGSGEPGWLDSDDLLAAELYGLEGVAVSADGTTLWIADGTRGEDVPYHRVRVVAL